jgi:nucleotide-binding universal stress UspA family protein
VAPSPPSLETGQPVTGVRDEMEERHHHSPLCGSQDRIVVGVDRSAGSVAALRWAGQEARIRQTHLHVVHAWQPPGRQPEAEAVLRDLLAEAFARLPAGVEQLAVQSNAAEALTAASHGAALLVVGSHMRGAFSQIFRSVSRRTAAFASCPVAAVREGQDRPLRSGVVVVGVDDSFTSRDALRWAAAEALRRKTRLKVVHTVVPLPRTSPWAQGEAREMLTHMLSEILTGPLEKVAVSIDTGPGEVPGGRPGTVRSRASIALIAAAQRADLLVVGSHGYGSASGALIGSVTSDCLRAAACPVVIIPQAREDSRRRVRAAKIAIER